MLFDEDQKYFNESKFLVDRFGRKLSGFVEHIWIDDMEFLIAFCNHFKGCSRYFHLDIRAKFSLAEEAQITHRIAMFPGIKMSEKDKDFIEDQIGRYVVSSLVKDHGGYSPVIMLECLKLRSKIKVSEGKINEVIYNELIATCRTIDYINQQGADLEVPEPVGYNRKGNTVALLKSQKLAPPVVMDEAMGLDENWEKYLSYIPIGIPSFKGLDSISSFARMRDSLVPTRSSLWILEKGWIEKLKKWGADQKRFRSWKREQNSGKDILRCLFQSKKSSD